MADSTPDPTPAPPVVQPPPPAAAADDGIRKTMAVGIIVQFTLYIVFVTFLLMKYGTNLSNTTNNIIVIILTAEIGYMGQTFAYYMGSSSGSTSKSALIEATKTPPPVVTPAPSLPPRP